MSLANKRKVMSSAVALLGALAIGCGDDSDDKGGGGGDGDTITATFTVVPILATTANERLTTPHEVVVWDSVTGSMDDPAFTGTTSNGDITITLPKSTYSFYIKGVGPVTTDSSTYDTIILNQPTGTGETLLRISNVGTASFAAATGKFEQKPDHAPAAGAVYWAPGGVRRGAVGCAKLYIDGKTSNAEEFDQRYNAANGLPTTLDALDRTLRAGRFYVGNFTPGKHTINASIDDGATMLLDQDLEFEITMVRSEARSDLKQVLYQLAVDVDSDANPTPADCPADPE